MARSLRRLVLPVVACSALLGLAVPAYAAPANTSTVTVKQCTETALRSAISSAAPGSRIRFGCDGTITLTVSGGSTIEIQKPLTLDGGGHQVTISGGEEVSLFFISGLADITFKNLTLADGWSQDYGLPGGGAIYNANAHLFADNVTFQDNHAFNYGGAIYNFGTYASSQVTGSRFVDNTVTCSITGEGGGAIASYAGGSTVLTGDSFTGNSATGLGNGGAVLGALTYHIPGSVSVANSTFTDNYVYIQQPPDVSLPGGGAIAVYNHPLSIDGSTFNANRAITVAGISAGGGVLVGQGDPNGPLPPQPATITNSKFLGNLAQHSTDYGYGIAGGIAALGPPVTISNTIMLSNGAADAGAIFSYSNLTLHFDTVNRNFASGFDQQPPYAGGIYNSGTATADHTQFIDNTPINCAGTTLVDAGGNVAGPDQTCF